jgi:hypothetical protein
VYTSAFRRPSARRCNLIKHIGGAVYRQDTCVIVMKSFYSHRSVYEFQSFNVIILSFVVSKSRVFNNALTFNHSDRKKKENIIINRIYSHVDRQFKFVGVSYVLAVCQETGCIDKMNILDFLEQKVSSIYLDLLLLCIW